MASDIKYNVKGSISTNTKRGVIGPSGTYDHAKLNNRDAADQHPVQAITGLVDYLNNFSNRIQEIIQGLADSDFQGQINRLNAQILSLIDYLPLTVSSSNKLVDQNQLNTRINEINETINQLNDDLSQNISQLDARLTNSIQELSESFTGDLNTLREVLDSFEESITNSLNQEIKDRTEADEQLRETIEQEIEPRLTTIESDIVSVKQEIKDVEDTISEDIKEKVEGLRQELATETLNREAADQHLSDYIDSEIEKLDEKIKTDLEPRLTELSNNIEDEAEARKEADTELHERIDSISIEELSKRTTYRTFLPENPSKNDRFVLVSEYTEGLNYYKHLEPVNTNYKMKFVPATVTAETFEPDTYYYYDENFNQEFVKTDVVKSSGYYPAYEFNPEDTYYEQVYDADDTNLSGM